MQAIVTRYLSSSATRGARITATAQLGGVTVDWDDSQGVYENHIRAAKALADKWGWGGRWYGGALPTDQGYCFVCAGSFRIPREAKMSIP